METGGSLKHASAPCHVPDESVITFKVLRVGHVLHVYSLSFQIKPNVL
jgi:hypothetical protein